MNSYAFDVLRTSLYSAQEDHKQARHFYEKAVQRGGIHAVALPYAETLCHLAEFNQTKTICSKMLEIKPKNAQAHMTLARVHYHLGDFHNKRQANESNPKGYFEYAPVTALVRDNAWLSEAKGKCVKDGRGHCTIPVSKSTVLA